MAPTQNDKVNHFSKVEKTSEQNHVKRNKEDNKIMELTIKFNLKYIKDLPNSENLATKIYSYIKENKNYSFAQIGAIIDEHCGCSCGLSIAVDIGVIY